MLVKARYRAIPTTILWCSGSGSTRKAGCKLHLVPSPCIADIRNRMRMIREATMSFAHSLCDRRSCALQGISFRAAALFAVLALLAARSSAQSAAGPAPALLEQQPAPASKTDTAPKPKAKAKPKKVYTNDDLQTRSAQVEEASSTETDYYAGLLKCDASCEKQASTEAYQGYDARTGAEAEEYTKRTGRDLDASFQLLSAQMRTRVNEVRFPDPATGALMNVQFMRVSACAPYVP